MRLFVLLTVCLCCSRAFAQDAKPTDSNDLLDPYRKAATDRWEKSISEFDTLNKAESHPDNSVLFIGSSSIRRWSTMATDMAPYSTIRRGYGGAKYTDMAVFVERIVSPHKYKALVMFVGNGVTGKSEDHTPEQIEELVRHIVSVSHKHQPQAPVFLIEITPCESRFNAWPKIRAANGRLREVALSTPDTYFVPTASHYLKADGTPRPELFVKDRLHLSEAGYDLWAKLIRNRLNDVLLARSKETAAKAMAEKSESKK